MIVGNDHVRAATQQMIALETVHTAVLVNFIAGDADSDAAHGFDGPHFRWAVAKRDDLIAAQPMLGHELTESALLGESWIVIDGSKDARAKVVIDVENV